MPERGGQNGDGGGEEGFAGEFLGGEVFPGEADGGGIFCVGGEKRGPGGGGVCAGRVYGYSDRLGEDGDRV